MTRRRPDRQAHGTHPRHGAHPGLAFLHVHSMRTRSGAEVLVARVLTRDGRTGFGFSFRLDPEEARRMAAWRAGAAEKPPEYVAVAEHPWERAWVAGTEIDWNLEPGFAEMRWLPEAATGQASAPPR